MTDEEYNGFKDFVLKNDFSYSTASEEMLKKMKETAEEEGYYEDSKQEYEDLMLKVVPSKERDLEKFKPQIRSFLENEIVSRYYFQSGRAQHSFNDDVSIQKAFELFQKKSEYNTILGN